MIQIRYFYVMLTKTVPSLNILKTTGDRSLNRTNAKDELLGDWYSEYVRPFKDASVFFAVPVLTYIL